MFRNIYKGLILLGLIAGALLLSDLDNRYPEVKSVAAYTGDANFVTAVTGKLYKIGMVYFGPDIALDVLWEGLFQGLREMGYVRDSNLLITSMHANGEIATIPTILQSIDNRDVDVIMTFTTPCLTAACVTLRNKPLVFTYCYDPVAAGAGLSFTDHLPFLTGVGSFPPLVKTIDAFEKLLPGIKSVGTIYNSSEANSRKVVETARGKFKEKGMSLEEMTVTTTNEVQQAMQVLCSKKPQLIWISGDNTAIMAFDAIIKEGNNAGIPVVINDADFLSKGALMAVGIDWYSIGYHTSSILSRVLNGENPSGIPIENYTREKIVFNHDAATQLGVTFSAELLSLADSNDSGLKINHKLKFGLLQFNDTPLAEDAIRGLQDGLREIGLTPGVDFTLDIKNAQGDISALPSFADAMIQGRYDMVFTVSTPTLQVALKRIKNIPLVFTNSSAPLSAGAGKSFTDHQSNLTGICTLGDYAKMIECLQQIKPGIKSIGTLFCQGEINSVECKNILDSCARVKGIRLVAIPINTTAEVTEASSLLCQQRIEFFCQISDNATASAFPTIADIAAKNKIPLSGFVGEQVNKGAFLVVARDYYQAGLDASRQAEKILRGQSPATIPIEYVSKTNVMINRSAAQKVGLTIPESLLKKASKVY